MDATRLQSKYGLKDFLFSLDFCILPKKKIMKVNVFFNMTDMFLCLWPLYAFMSVFKYRKIITIMKAWYVSVRTLCDRARKKVILTGFFFNIMLLIIIMFLSALNLTEVPFSWNRTFFPFNHWKSCVQCILGDILQVDSAHIQRLFLPPWHLCVRNLFSPDFFVCWCPCFCQQEVSNIMTWGHSSDQILTKYFYTQEATATRDIFGWDMATAKESTQNQLSPPLFLKLLLLFFSYWTLICKHNSIKCANTLQNSRDSVVTI